MSPQTIIPAILDQHVEETAILWAIRSHQVRATRVGLTALERTDSRIDAHIDGVMVAGDAATQRLLQTFGDVSAAQMFAVSSLALSTQDWDLLTHCLSVCEAVHEGVPGVASSLGWVEFRLVRGFGRTLLGHESATRRALGLVACRMHQIDPGAAVRRALEDGAPTERTEALRAIGSLGIRHGTDACQIFLDHEELETAFWSAWASVLLGDRDRALDVLTRVAASREAHSGRARRLLLQAMPTASGHRALQRLSSANAVQDVGMLVEGSGIVGDPTYAPWLIRQMHQREIARAAGDAFTLITGADLSALELDGPSPEDFESGPNDNPDDENVDMDPDEDLPWPDVEKIEKWWAVNSHRFQKGQRYFMGAPVTKKHCIEVLKTGYQRQRILAAHYLCLLEPGTPLFNTSAPAWRQQRLLARM